MSHPLLIEISRFAMGKLAYHREEPPETTQQLVKSGLKLLEELPVLRDSIFELFSLVFDVSIGNHIKLEKTPQAPPQNDKAVLLIKEGLEKLIFEQSWAAPYISQWSLSRLIKPSIEYAKILNLDFKAACSLWLNCNGTRILLDLCGLCFNRFDDVEMQRFIYDLENVFADNRPNFDWGVAHLSSLFPLKFISNILRMPSMLTPAFISSTVTVLEFLSNASEKNLKNLLREIIDEALDGDQNDLKSRDYIPNLIQLSSKSETYAQAIMNVFLDYMQQGAEKFVDKLKRQVLTRPLDYNPDKLHTILPELILRTKENGTKVILMLTDTFESNTWCMELVEIVITELEQMVFNDKMCPLFNDIRKETSWEILGKGCQSSKKLLQQTAIRLILISTSERNPILYYKTIEELMTKNTITHPHIFNALVLLLDDPVGINDIPDISIAIAHIIQKLSIDINLRTHQNQCYFILKNLTELVNFEKANSSFGYLKRGLIKGSLQSSIRILIHTWEILLRKVMNDVENFVITSENEKFERAAMKRIKLEEDPMEIADLEEETTYNTKEQIHMMTRLICQLNLNSLNISDAIRCEKLTVKYFFWCLTETDTLSRLKVIERCLMLLSKQCLGNKGIRSAALRDLIEGALFLYPNLFGAPRHIVEKSSNQIYHAKDESLLKLNQKQGISLNTSRSSILHSGVIGCGIPKISQPWIPDGLDDEIKNIFIKAIMECCQDEGDETGHAKLMDGLCYVSQLLVELVVSDVMYNSLVWSAEEEFTKITMERDLHVRRTFKNCPILWSLMGLLAQYKMPLWCNCSVLLRALCASVMHHWRAKSIESKSGNNTELMFFTIKLLELLALGGLLPSPLNFLHIVVPHFEPNEIAYILKECVWNYMVANGATFYTSEDGKLNLEPVAEQFVDPLRNTMQKKLSTLGNLYYQMFILPQNEM